METREPPFDPCAVTPDVLLGPLPERLTRRDNRGVRLAHGGRREVGMHTCAVPVTLNRFRVQVSRDVIVLGDAIEQPPGHPEMIPDCHRVERSYLELPLTDHHPVSYTHLRAHETDSY